MNDFHEIAYLSNADGVHVGQQDESVEKIRKIYGKKIIIGTSNATVGEAEISFSSGADYIAIGSIFPTKTKIDTRPAGLETLLSARKIITSSIVAIGGIKISNASRVIKAGADSICVTTAITKSRNPEKSASLLSQKFLN